jgi:hypothetical protein
VSEYNSEACGACSCAPDANGTARTRCDLSGCGCVVDGILFHWGEQVLTLGPNRNGSEATCSRCRCDESGSVSCDEFECDQDTSCEYQGETYASGAIFAAGDGCNTCVCNGAIAGVSCTENDCACDYRKQWYRRYSRFPVSCEAPLRAFDDACGTGCEQALDCPEWIDCSGGEATCDRDLLERCPFSMISAPPGGLSGGSYLCDGIDEHSALGDPRCLSCLEGSCCAELQNCMSDSNCRDYQQCIVECQQVGRESEEPFSLSACIEESCPDVADVADENPVVLASRACRESGGCASYCDPETL